MSHDLQFNVTQNGQPLPMDTNNGGMPPMSGNNGSNSNNGGGIMSGQLSQSSHPFVCIFHVLFKGVALFLYIFGGYLAKDSNGHTSGAKFITLTVCCILALAADFWVVKNITGRLLVGLRWWNQVEGDSTRWIFESAGNDKVVNPFDRSVFWTVLYATPLLWTGLLFIGLLKFNLGWLIIVVMALSLSVANVYGYYKCSSDQKAQFQQMMQTSAQAGAMSAIKSGLFGFLAGTSTSQQQQQQQPQSQSQTYV